MLSASLVLFALATREAEAGTFRLTETIADSSSNLYTAIATFTGTLEGNYVDNISGVSLSINGTSPSSAVYAFGGDAYGHFHNGQAIVGVNAYQQLNNFYFVDDPIENDSYPQFTHYIFASLAAYENAVNPQYGIALYTLIQDLTHDTRFQNYAGGILGDGSYYYNCVLTPFYNCPGPTFAGGVTVTYNLVETSYSIPLPPTIWLLSSGFVSLFSFVRRIK